MGFEVKMKAGNRAICCSEYGGDWLEASVASESSLPPIERVEGEGEGGNEIVACEEAFPFDLDVISQRSSIENG